MKSQIMSHVLRGTVEFTPATGQWDAYYTPKSTAEALLRCLPIRDGDSVLEPSVGSDAWLAALRGLAPRTVRGAIDIDPSVPGLTDMSLSTWRRAGDFLAWHPASWTASPHWVVGNPPYSGVNDHILHALRCVRRGGSVAMLLGVGILSGQQRWAELYSHLRPRMVVHLPMRQAFHGRARDGSVLDGTRTAGRDNVFVWWDTAWTGPTVSAWLNPATNSVTGGWSALPTGASHV